MLLQRIASETVAEQWRSLKHAVAKGLQPYRELSPLELSYLQSAALSGNLHLWVLYDDNKDIVAILSTTSVEELVTRQRMLLLFSYYKAKDTTREVLVAALAELMLFATSKGCIKIIGYTTDEAITELLKSAGLHSETYFELGV